MSSSHTQWSRWISAEGLVSSSGCVVLIHMLSLMYHSVGNTFIFHRQDHQLYSGSSPDQIYSLFDYTDGEVNTGSVVLVDKLIICHTAGLMSMFVAQYVEQHAAVQMHQLQFSLSFFNQPFIKLRSILLLGIITQHLWGFHNQEHHGVVGQTADILTVYISM